MICIMIFFCDDFQNRFFSLELIFKCFTFLPMIHLNIFCLYCTSDGDYIISVSSKTDRKQKMQRIHVMFFFINEIIVRLSDMWCPFFSENNQFLEMSHDILSLEGYTLYYRIAILLAIAMNENPNTPWIGTKAHNPSM